MPAIRLVLAVTFCKVVQRSVSSAKPRSPRPRSDRISEASHGLREPLRGPPSWPVGPIGSRYGRGRGHRGGADVHVQGDAVVGVAGHTGHVGGIELPGEQGGGTEHVPQAVPGPPAVAAGVAPAAGANPLGLVFPSLTGKHWRSSNFNRNVLQRAYLASG
jgi:hypothetical protein